ncbi:MerR family DNA-binding transcriptional regulator [Caenimonas sedimenti]|uniref:MerR family DNA-binding transcriptional regulator n=2 Tax=Caenimonas sedimenti TaxID=2596921 RepID=A0A562ZN82_9BURK|nr:MerR family DNA-binding transcriptional regulator [Caenimonas sedimenti]
MSISEAAAAAAVTPKMIRHYESLGLIPQAERSESGYRLYSKREVDMLRFVRQARALGFPIPQIDALMRLWQDDDRESRAVREVAHAQLLELQQRRKELDEMATTLEALVQECAGDDNACCPILAQLSAPLAARLALAPVVGSTTLKEVKAGSRAKAPRRRSHIERPPQRAHTALEMWSRSAASPL